MKTQFDMVLFDNGKNRAKSDALCSLDIMFDDSDNPLPDEWYSFWNSDAGIGMPWGTKVRITLEVVDDENENPDSLLELTDLIQEQKERISQLEQMVYNVTKSRYY
jgi:hypothetical protein